MINPINPETLKVKDIIIVNKWLSHKDNSWVGDLFEVTFVELPYVFAKFKQGMWKGDIKRFNTNNIEFGEVSDLYIEHMLTTEK